MENGKMVMEILWTIYFVKSVGTLLSVRGCSHLPPAFLDPGPLYIHTIITYCFRYQVTTKAARSTNRTPQRPPCRAPELTASLWRVSINKDLGQKNTSVSGPAGGRYCGQ